eukprot:scaffold72056_cov57-Phaeocystis_antarctica.AAC.2
MSLDMQLRTGWVRSQGQQDVDQQLAPQHALRARQQIEPRPYTPPQPSAGDRGRVADEVPAGDVGAEGARAVRSAAAGAQLARSAALRRLAVGARQDGGHVHHVRRVGEDVERWWRHNAALAARAALAALAALAAAGLHGGQQRGGELPW